MPYIDINTNVSVSPEQKLAIKSEMGRLLPILPGKSEDGLIVAIADGRDMWRSGRSDEPVAFVDVRVYREQPAEEKKRFVEAVIRYLCETLAIPVPRCYLTFTEYRQWGFDGTLNFC